MNMNYKLIQTLNLVSYGLSETPTLLMVSVNDTSYSRKSRGEMAECGLQVQEGKKEREHDAHTTQHELYLKSLCVCLCVSERKPI